MYNFDLKCQKPLKSFLICIIIIVQYDTISWAANYLSASAAVGFVIAGGILLS